MDDDAEGIHGIAVQEDVELDHVGGPELEEVVVEGGVALGDGLEPVVEVDDDLAQREVELDVHPLADVLERLVLAALVLGELVDLAHELGGHQDGPPDVGLLDALDLVHRRQLGGVLHLDGLALGRHHSEPHAGGGDDQRQVELALEPLLHDLEVQHAEEAAAEAVAERERGLRLEVEGGVVQAELLERVAEPFVVGVLDGVESREDHGLGVAIARAWGGGRASRVGDGLAHLRVGDALDGRGQEADLPRFELVHGPHVGREHAHLLDFIDLAVGHEQRAHPGAHAPVDQADVHDHTLVGVVEGVEHEGLERRLGVAHRRRHALDDGLEHLGHAGAVLGGDRDGLVAVEPEHLGDLVPRALHVRRGEVDLVDDRDDLEAAVVRQVEVGEGLCLHPLGRIDDQDGSLAGGERPRDLVGEVDVAGGIDEVERVLVPVARGVEQAHGMRLDGDAPLLFEVHGVEDLVHRLLGVHRAREGQKPVGQG